MSERQKLELAIEALEARRADLGDSVVDAALVPLREKLASLEAAAPSGERRVVTVLFCDVVGSTAVAEQVDPEEWTRLMNAIFERLNEPVDRYGGTVSRLMGDAILAFFGAPMAHEDDSERALLAGLAILENIAPLRERVKRQQGVDFNVRVGINTGLVVTGLVGSDVRSEYTAMGDAVNLAARMEQTAAPGTIQISEDTYRLVAPIFETEALGEIQVKGKSRPVPTYRVLGRKAEPGRVRGLEKRGLRSPLVGRDAELAILAGRVERLRERKEGGIALIFGEAGLGKSTVVSEMRSRAAGNGIRWLEGHTLSFGESLSYWPFREIVWDFAGISEKDEERAAWEKLEGSVSRLFPEGTADYVPYLASLLALEVRDPYREKVTYLDAEALGRQVYLASRRFFERLALDRPLVLLFEDLHWMDDASARLLEHLLPLVERVPLLIIGLSRPEAGAAGERIAQLAGREQAGRYTELRLTPLPPEESRTLVQNLLSVDGLPAHVRQRIVDRAGGNPFFLEEIIRTLIETGAVEQDSRSGRWRATKSIETLRLPDTVQGVIIARVDRLGEEVKEILRTASVIGRSFLHRLLREVMKLDREVDRGLATLQEIDLIREKQRQPELEYIFKHALAQEAVYEGILLEIRRHLHQRVAETVEVLFGERLEKFYGLLAYHYARADAPEKALNYLLKAGDLAGQVAADAEALAYYRQALSAYQQAFGDLWDPLQRATLERKMGQALFRRGEHAQAQEHLQQALIYLAQPLPSSRWAVRRAILAEVIRQALIRLVPGLMQVPETPEGIAGEHERLMVYEALGLIYVVRDQERFMLVSLKGLNLWERSGHPPVFSQGFVGLAAALDLMGLYTISSRYHRLAKKVAIEKQSPLSSGFVHYGLGIHYSWLGLPAKALEHGVESARYYREAGDLRGLGSANFIMAETLAYQGHVERAGATARQVLDLGRESSDAQLEAWGLLLVGSVQRLAGDLNEAISLLRQSDEMARPIPDYFVQVQASAIIGHCHLDTGHLELALNSLHEAQRIVEEHNVIGGRFISMVQAGLGRAYLLAAEEERGSDKKSALAQAKRACREARRQTRKYRPFRAQAYRLQGTYDWLIGHERQAVQWWEKSLALAGDIGQPYEQAITYLEMGRRQGVPSLIEQAKVILADLGARPDLMDVN